jgi:hypothetical protein
MSLKRSKNMPAFDDFILISKDKKLPFYANYFHAVSLKETRNIFNTKDNENPGGSVDATYNSNYETVNLIEKIIKPLEGKVLKSEGEKLMIPLEGLLYLPLNADKVPLVLIGHGNFLSYFDDKGENYVDPTFDSNGKLLNKGRLDFRLRDGSKGDRDKEILSYSGYMELQKYLQERGIASYSINLNIANALDNTESSAFNKLALDSNQRILLFFLHLMLLKIMAGESVSIPASEEHPIKFKTNTGLEKLNKVLADSTSSTDDEALQKLKKLRVDLAGKIDFEKLGFMGHSRGADAVSRISSYFYKKDGTSPGPTFPMNLEVDSRIKRIAKLIGKPPQDFIKCILALEPVSIKDPEDTKHSSKHGYVIDNEQTMFFAVAGTHDRDVTLDSIRIYEYPECPKAMIAINGATHVRFNTVWKNSKKHTQKRRLLKDDEHMSISKTVFGSCFIASLKDESHYLYFTQERKFVLDLPQDFLDFQSAWKFGFPFRTSPTSPKVLKELDDNIVGVREKQLKGKKHKFEQEDILAFYIEKKNSGSSTIEIPIDPNNNDENLSKYTHFSFRFAKGLDLSHPERIEKKNFTVQLFKNTSPIGKLIAGKDIKTIKLRAYQAFDEEFEKKVDENGKRKHVFEPSILLQTVEIELSRFKVSDLNKVNRIQITVIPDKTKLPPLSTQKRISGSIVGGTLGAALFYLGASKLIFNEEDEHYEKSVIIATGLGFVIVGGISYFILKADKNAFVFKDFLLTNRKISLTT